MRFRATHAPNCRATHTASLRATHTATCAIGVLTAMTLASCGGPSQTEGLSSTGSADEETITVFAAASLTESFTEIAATFESKHPGIDVEYNFAGSSTLARQLERGAPADVFASANQQQMGNVVDAGLAADPATFTTNKLRIATPAGNPAGIDGLEDFADEEKTVALCAEQVPCGAAAQEAFDAAGVEPSADTLEQDVKAVLTKVSLGEADAGLVYVTDVAAAGGEVEGLDFPEAGAAVNEYTIAAMEQAPHRKAAKAFVEYVQSPQGQRILGQFGFMAPGK